MKMLLLSCVLAVATSTSGSRLAVELEELLEMIPYEQMLNLGMEYAMADPQVKSLMQYISGDKFRDNVAGIQSSPEFFQLAEVSATHDIDAFALANKFNSALDMPPLSYKVAYQREKRSPGDGVAGLIKDMTELTPLDDMKEAFKYKLDHIPEFKVVLIEPLEINLFGSYEKLHVEDSDDTLVMSLVNKLMSGEAKKLYEPIFASKPFQETKLDLQEMGIPLDELSKQVSDRLHKFFDFRTETTTS